MTRQTLVLDADPRSVQEARRWVSSACEELGRVDLLECAILGVSELVTNALLHAGDPITVRLRGTTDHPRIEVTDGSPEPPVLTVAAAPELDDLLATFGRGLSIVARCSVAWGATIEPEGKVVWFEPATVPHQDSFPEGALFDSAAPAATPGPREPQALVRVALDDVPVSIATGLRRHYHDLRREVRLLSLAHEDDYPLAKNLTDIFAQFDHAFPAEATHQIESAAATHRPTVDIRAQVDRAATPLFEQMLALLDLADEFCRAQRLLSLARTPEQVAFQRWYLTEFIRQAQGERPLPWRPVPPPAEPSDQSSKNVS